MKLLELVMYNVRVPITGCILKFIITSKLMLSAICFAFFRLDSGK